MIEVSTTAKRKNGEEIIITVEFEEELGTWLLTQPEEIIHDFVMFEYKNNSSARAFTRRVQSLDLSVENGHEFADTDDFVADIIRESESEQVRIAISKLTEKQQWLVYQVFYLERKQNDVANELGLSKMAITLQLQTIYTKLKKYLRNF